MPNNTTAPAAESKTIQYHTSPIPHDTFQESVYNLLPVQVTIPPKQSMYKSIHAEQVKQEEKKGKKLAASMGRIQVSKPPPQKFLRKGQGVVQFKQSGNQFLKASSPAKHVKTQLKPALPKEKGVLPKKSQKSLLRSMPWTIFTLV